MGCCTLPGAPWISPTGPRSYICEAASWGSLPHDLRSIALYHTGRLEEALGEAQAALELEPGSERLRSNVEILGRQLQT